MYTLKDLNKESEHDVAVELEGCRGRGKRSVRRVERIGEGNGNPLQYSCLEKSMDRGAWLAAVHGVT